MPPPRMPARDMDASRPPVIRTAAPASQSCVESIDVSGIATSPRSRSSLVSRHRVADDERHRHREPARERVAIDERSVGRRSGADRLPGPVEQRRRRRTLHRDERRQREAQPRDAPDDRSYAAARERRPRAPEETDVRRAERQRPHVDSTSIDRARAGARRRLDLERDDAIDGQRVRRQAVAQRRRPAESAERRRR